MRLSSEQKELYDYIMGVVKKIFGSFITAREDGALIGPFKAMLHVPAFGRANALLLPAAFADINIDKS